MPLAHHVGLVVKAAGHRDIDDAARVAEEQPAGSLEPKDPSGRFGRDTELRREAFAEVSPAEAAFPRERVNGMRP